MDPPTLLIHGDADPLVHISHSIVMSEKFNATGVESDFVTIEGGKHGFSGENAMSRANQARLEWFQKHLLQ